MKSALLIACLLACSPALAVESDTIEQITEEEQQWVQSYMKSQLAKKRLLLFDLEIGQVGYLGGMESGAYEVIQIIDAQNCLVRQYNYPRAPIRWLVCSTTGMADGTVFNMNMCLVVLGTKSYTSTTGARTTVWQFRVIDIQRLLALYKQVRQTRLQQKIDVIKTQMDATIRIRDELRASRVGKYLAAQRKAKMYEAIKDTPEGRSAILESQQIMTDSGEVSEEEIQAYEVHEQEINSKIKVLKKQLDELK